MSAKLEVLWSPVPTKFVTWGPEISLYETFTRKEPAPALPPGAIRLSDTTCAKLLSTNTMHHYVKCLDIYPKSTNDLLFAVGLSNGRIALTAFGPSEYDALGLTGKELVPRHARQCNAVSWNTVECNLIAGGLDKCRSDNCVLIWDINKNPQVDAINTMTTNSRLNNTAVLAAVELAKPIAEFGMSEIANSIEWFNTSPKILAVGMNGKHIKLVDIRDSNKVVNSTLTKAVYGVCIERNDDKHIASFVENFICIWDTRNFEKPLLTLPQSKQVVKVSWCPTKHNLLSSLQKDSSVITLYDIQHTIIGNEEVEPSALERVVVPGSPHNIMSFSWHNTDENRFLSIALSGTVTDFTVFDRITHAWAPSSNLIWSYGAKTMKLLDDEPLNDISTEIKRRVRAKYGLQDELWRNGEIVQNEMLANVWNWLYLSGKLVEDGVLSGTNSKHPGVQTVLNIDPNTSKSDLQSILWADLGNTNCQGVVRIYKHEDRDKALHLCSWPFEHDNNRLTKFLEQLQKEHAYTRAAAIAVFNLKIRLAIDILNKASDDSMMLSVVAMALAGFCDDKASMWKQFCSTIKHKLADPYLKVIFSFLTAENFNYDAILNENGIAVDDRVAFACLFLPDNRLHEYLKKLSEKLIDEGNLDGLLLTGNNHDGIRLLQKYLDATGDIQSTALIAGKAFPMDPFIETIERWVNCYRALLNSWQMWVHRCHFDIMMANYWPPEKKSPPQVYISCNFCGKSISAYLQGLARARGPYSRIGGTANKIKLSACPNCRKPLPRCAICMMHMGTQVGPTRNPDGSEEKPNPIDNWFTWCQTCRHGGHTGHMTNWFKEHAECPVNGCTCKCNSLDAISDLTI